MSYLSSVFDFSSVWAWMSWRILRMLTVIFYTMAMARWFRAIAILMMPKLAKVDGLALFHLHFRDTRLWLDFFSYNLRLLSMLIRLLPDVFTDVTKFLEWNIVWNTILDNTTQELLQLMYNYNYVICYIDSLLNWLEIKVNNVPLTWR